jgi:hypothetical protein
VPSLCPLCNNYLLNITQEAQRRAVTNANKKKHGAKPHAFHYFHYITSYLLRTGLLVPDSLLLLLFFPALLVLFVLPVLLTFAGDLELAAGADFTVDALVVAAFCTVVVRGAGLVTLAAGLFVAGVFLTVGVAAAFLSEEFTEVLFWEGVTAAFLSAGAEVVLRVTVVFLTAAELDIVLVIPVEPDTLAASLFLPEVLPLTVLSLAVEAFLIAPVLLAGLWVFSVLVLTAAEVLFPVPGTFPSPLFVLTECAAELPLLWLFTASLCWFEVPLFACTLE